MRAISYMTLLTHKLSPCGDGVGAECILTPVKYIRNIHFVVSTQSRKACLILDTSAHRIMLLVLSFTIINANNSLCSVLHRFICRKNATCKETLKTGEWMILRKQKAIIKVGIWPES